MTRSEFGQGVVIGKFLPPHAGHHFLIRSALSRCDEVVVIVCGKPSDPIPPDLRSAWLREVHPSARVMLIDDRYDENDSRVWAENTRHWLGRTPDVVFTSESYGDPYAAHLGCRHVLLDHARIAVPCSGTAVRADPFGCWKYLEAPVRAWFAKRVVVLGAESTGTTTLARDLAAALKTCWVPEYGREYSERKQRLGDSVWNTGEFLKIAVEQNRREEEAARNSDRIVIGDTNAFATCLWHRRYLGVCDPELEALGRKSSCDLYLLTGDEIPFVQDGLRDGEHIRHEMQGWFMEALSAQEVPWILIEGSRETRLQRAMEEITARFPGIRDS